MSEPVTMSAPDPPARRSTLTRVAAVAAATLVVAAGITFVASRDDAATLPRLALRTPATNPAAADVGQAEASMRALASNVTTRYLIDAKLADPPTTAGVAKITAEPITAAEVAAWARTLGISTPPERDQSGPLDAWRAVEADGSLTVMTTGSTWLFNYHRGDQGGGSSPGAPGPAVEPSPAVEPEPPTSEAEPPPTTDPDPTTFDLARPDLPDAATVRRNGIATLTDLGILDGADWDFAVRDGGTVGVASACLAGATCGQAEQVFTLSRQLVATRVVEGRHVDGLDWIVDFGDGGRIETVTGTIAAARRIGDYPLRSVSDAVASLNAGIDGGPAPAALDSLEPDLAVAPCDLATDCAPREVTITISGVEVGTALWFGGSGDSPSEYLVPTFRFTGHDDAGNPWTASVLALTDAALLAPPTTTTTTPGGEESPGPSVTIGASIPLPLDLNFHCGVSEVRFNATWWDAVNPWPGSGGGSPHIADGEGTLTLDRLDHASWDNGSGVSLEFVPHVGAHERQGCA